MPTIDSASFHSSPEDALHDARHEPVEIMQHGRRAFVLMSTGHYDWLRASVQRRHRTAEAIDVVIDAVERAEMDAGFTPLDALLR